MRRAAAQRVPRACAPRHAPPTKAWAKASRMLPSPLPPRPRDSTAAAALRSLGAGIAATPTSPLEYHERARARGAPPARDITGAMLAAELRDSTPADARRASLHRLDRAAPVMVRDHGRSRLRCRRRRRRAGGAAAERSGGGGARAARGGGGGARRAGGRAPRQLRPRRRLASRRRAAAAAAGARRSPVRSRDGAAAVRRASSARGRSRRPSARVAPQGHQTSRELYPGAIDDEEAAEAAEAWAAEKVAEEAIANGAAEVAAAAPPDGRWAASRMDGWLPPSPKADLQSEARALHAAATAWAAEKEAEEAIAAGALACEAAAQPAAGGRRCASEAAPPATEAATRRWRRRRRRRRSRRRRRRRRRWRRRRAALDAVADEALRASSRTRSAPHSS